MVESCKKRSQMWPLAPLQHLRCGLAKRWADVTGPHFGEVVDLQDRMISRLKRLLLRSSQSSDALRLAG